MIGEPDIDYTELYQRFIINEWAAIKLDDAVALAALERGNPILDIFFTLHQGPFIQYQIYEKGMVKLAMTRYARCTVHDAFMRFKRQQQRQRRYLPQQKQNASAVTR
ncbi:MAG: hypothetical protein AAF243_15985 [Cyanobacteria bacterium P01_A01_bin.137]